MKPVTAYERIEKCMVDWTERDPRLDVGKQVKWNRLTEFLVAPSQKCFQSTANFTCSYPNNIFIRHTYTQFYHWPSFDRRSSADVLISRSDHVTSNLSRCFWKMYTFLWKVNVHVFTSVCREEWRYSGTSPGVDGILAALLRVRNFVVSGSESFRVNCASPPSPSLRSRTRSMFVFDSDGRISAGKARFTAASLRITFNEFSAVQYRVAFVWRDAILIPVRFTSGHSRWIAKRDAIAKFIDETRRSRVIGNFYARHFRDYRTNSLFLNVCAKIILRYLCKDCSARASARRILAEIIP